MKRYRLSFADSITHKPEHPERTAWRSGTGLDMDRHYQVWPSRAAMLKTVELQGRSTPHHTHWKPCQRGS